MRRRGMASMLKGSYMGLLGLQRCTVWREGLKLNSKLLYWIVSLERPAIDIYTTLVRSLQLLSNGMALSESGWQLAAV